MDYRKNLTLIDPDAVPTHAFLMSMLDRLSARRSVEPSAWDFLRYYVRPLLEDKEAIRVSRCWETIGRYTRPDGAAHLLDPWVCHSQWCPRCAWSAYRRRVPYVCDKLRSVSPTRELRLFHFVVEPPTALHPIIRDSPAGLEAFRRATWTGIARSFGYHSGREGSTALGAYFSLHPWGDKQGPWPRWFPHFDAVMPAYVKRDGRLEPLNGWPCLFPKTRRYIVDALREEFKPVLAGMGLTDDVLRAHAELDGSRATCIFHVSRAAKGDTSRVALEKAAGRRVSYSVRPLFDPGRVALRRQESGGWAFTYQPQGAQVRHWRNNPAEVAAALVGLEDFIGGFRVHHPHGYLARAAYTKTARLAGNRPVEERPRTGRRLVALYDRGPDGRYDPEVRVRRPKPRQGGEPA